MRSSSFVTAPTRPPPIDDPESPPAAEGMAPREADRLSLAVIWSYSLPAVAFGPIAILFSMYLMKFSTDVLMIAPATMGTLFAASRLWDGISDPMAGYLSDRTRSRHGRRRSWMFASAIPIALGVVMMWSAPVGLTPLMLVVWMAVALFVYETASTAFHIPHGALGVELTSSYHERTRLFGYRHVIGMLGIVLGLGAFFVLDRGDDKRAIALAISLGSALLLLGVIFYSTWRVPERAEFQGRGARTPLQSMLDVVRNEHARLLLLVYAIETFGVASISMLLPYMTEYVLDLPGQTTYIALLYFVPQVILTPLWVSLSRRYGKKRLWLLSMVATSIGFASLFFIEDGDSLLIWTVTPVIGFAAGCGAVVAPSIKADIIDYDEYRTNERKEGAYLAVWNLIRKASGAITALITGIVLDIADFQPNEIQSEETKLAMRAIFGLLPGFCYAIGALLFSRFGFNEQEQVEVRRVLDQRRSNGMQD